MITLLTTMSVMLSLADGSGLQNRMILTNDCPCPGHNITFECTVIGGGTTVWRGDIFDCPDHSNEIILRHINFHSSVSGECNAGAVIGQGLRIDGNHYTSELSIVYSESFAERNLTCIHDNGVTISSTITAMIIHNMIVSYPSPSNVLLIDASPRQLTFNWNPVAPHCTAIHYKIAHNNCGDCPSTTPHNTVVCRDMKVGMNLTCSFVVQNLRTCDGIFGNRSAPVEVTLKVPSAPVVVVTPHYSHINGELIGLETSFNQVDSFQISNGFDGSALYYEIMYNNSVSGMSCGLSMVPASHCTARCVKLDMLSSLSCFLLSGGINVTVSAHSVLGRGEKSNPITVSTEVNRFVDVDVRQTSYRVTCNFLYSKHANIKNCSIVYGQLGGNCRTLSQASSSLSDIVTIGLPFEEDLEMEYCFSVTASNGTFTAVVEGTFKVDPNNTAPQSCSVAVGVSVTITFAIMINIITAIALSVIIYILVRSKRKVVLELEQAKARELHGVYEDLDYMYVDRPNTAKAINITKAIDTLDNISYSVKRANSELSVYEDTK